MSDFDLFVVGAGSGGVRAARMAAAAGARVAVAEERYMGGTCVNVGCIPKKLYSYAAHYRYDFDDSAGFGWRLEPPQFCWDRLRDGKQREIARLNDIYKNLLTSSGATILPGRARLCDANTVEMDGKRITSKYILLATGGWPFVPEFPGREHVVTSNEIFDLPQFPQRILIVGAGYIAVEFAGIFAGLGATTMLAYRSGEVLKDFDADLRQRFTREAVKHIELMPNTLVASVEKGEGGLLVTLENGRRLEVDCVLFATGRKPNVANLGLENTRVALNPDGTVAVDANMQTAEPSIYALGDVVGRLALTPVALAEGMMVADRLFGDGRRTVSYENVATTIFSHPNIATVGLGEAEATERFADLTIFESDFRALRHTMSGRDERTYMKVIVDTASDRVVGMHMMGPDAGEVIQGFAAAMNCGLTKAQLDGTLGIHPTLAEEFVTMRTPARQRSCGREPVSAK
ncbi:MAG TPA: glutathione-disulfide reductase [Pseudomonadales bacterium]